MPKGFDGWVFAYLGQSRGQAFVIIIKNFPGELLTDSKEAVQKWLADHTERFISVFRPRIDQLLREQG